MKLGKEYLLLQQAALYQLFFFVHIIVKCFGFVFKKVHEKILRGHFVMDHV